MANGSYQEIARLKALNMFEFYAMLDLWEEKQQREYDILKAQHKK
ncbi:MAG TPA: hypothetical protein VD794_07000 [Flavisolibacter sp.]|nr:hypothetical protein [Flavisolibacter sp.]